MLIPEKLKLNKFKEVRIPTNKELFGRVGIQGLGVAEQYSGDQSAVLNTSKIDAIIEADNEFRDQLNNPE